MDRSDDHGHNYDDNDDNMKVKRNTRHGFPGARWRWSWLGHRGRFGSL